MFSRILGWDVLGRFVDKAFAAHASRFQFEYLNFDMQANSTRVPWHKSFGDGARTRHRLATLIEEKKLVGGDYAAFVFQGHDLGVPFRRYFDRDVGIIADTTPAITKRRAALSLGLRSVLKRLWCELEDQFVFRPMFRRVRSFLVLSDYVRQSLVVDYGVEDSKIFTIGLPVYEQIAALGRREKAERPVILFVGNDFLRKGGQFLLSLYRAHFAKNADLWIVSKGIDAANLEPSIRVFSNIPHADVLELMLRCHVLVFPSFHDELGLVLAEATCAGLPIVARQSGGQAEYVKDGENGYLLPHAAEAPAWRAAIDSILTDGARRARFAAAGARLGARLCSQRRFDEEISKFLACLAG